MKTYNNLRRLLWIGAFSNHVYDYTDKEDAVHSFHFPLKEATDFLTHEDGIHAVIITMLHKPSEIFKIKQIADLNDIPLFIYTPDFQQGAKELASKLGVDDYCYGSLRSSLMLRIEFIRRLKIYKRENRSRLKKARSRLKAQIILPAIKRSFDIITSSVAIIALSPVLILIASMILLGSGGSFLEAKRRVGFGYNTFNLYMFKTSRNDACSKMNSWFNYFGHFLCSSGLSELPALFNVLKGDMTFVGSSPMTPFDASKLTEDHAALRFRITAGITGLWRNRVSNSVETA